MNLITPVALEKLRLKAKSGNAKQKAEYAKAKREFNEVLEYLFDSNDYPYVQSPSEEYVKRLEEEAKNGGENEQKRFELIKSIFKEKEKRKSGEEARNFKLERQKVTEKAVNEGELTLQDVERARIVAAKNPSPQNRTYFAVLKRKYEEQQTKAE